MAKLFYVTQLELEAERDKLSNGQSSKTYDEFNQILITIHGVSLIIAGAGFLFKKQGIAAGALVASCAFMMATKDNHWIKSSVSAITREKKDRLENFCRDVSLIGVGLIFLGGMAKDSLGSSGKTKQE